MCDELVRLEQEVEHSATRLHQAKNDLSTALIEDINLVAPLHNKVEGAERKLLHDQKALRIHVATHLDCRRS